jgi:hypothetical protein
MNHFGGQESAKLLTDSQTYKKTGSNVHRKRLNYPITCLDRPVGFQEGDTPIFPDSLRIKVASLSALRTGRLYPPVDIPGTHFC